GVFPNLTVSENLDLYLTTLRDRAEIGRRRGRVFEVFPLLASRLDTPAGQLSGGQRQMLALALGLVHEPEVLVVDELSLGLAPVVVQELRGVVERLREQGQTMVVVEQSLNIALALADRAVFMEKGRVRFEGSARELAERDDLARAVFLGGEGG
ncbi:MAG: ATP-binding cassette domain-containing protein, partial [Acidimicrobiia bacterium]